MEALLPGLHQVELKRKVADVIFAKTRAEWEAFAKDHDVCLEPVLRPDELATDPHLAARGMFYEMQTPRGPIPQLRLPITPRDATPSAPPRSGEHTREILGEAGLSDVEIDALIATGAAR
jgi:alpha-methylacyl-CoA racemase